MRRFNPEKELYKIQHGNRNKIILSMLFGIILLAIGYSFALYQVRYSKRIIYTKVAPFSSKDIELAVNIKGEGPRDTFPAKEDGYVYMGTECDNKNEGYTTISWDEEAWRLNISTEGPNKCTVKFGSTYTVKAVVESHGSVSPSTQEVKVNGISEEFTIIPEEGYRIDKITCDNNQKVIAPITENKFKVSSVTNDSECTISFTLVSPKMFSEIIVADNDIIFEDGTEQNNIRYAGKNPNNYIWFNCNNYYGDINEENCEKWRIIGLFKGIKKTSGGTEDLVKIIRADRLGQSPWDSSNSNNWTRPSDLQRSLNDAYLTPNDDGSWMTWKEPSYKSITESTLGMIEQVTWNIGAMGYAKSSAKVLDWYTAERGTEVPSGASATWDGYIGLIYPSDYGYATVGTDSTSRDKCLTTPMSWSAMNTPYWGTSPYRPDCGENDWLWPGSSTSAWTLTPYSESTTNAFKVNNSGAVSFDSGGTKSSESFWPSLYLTSGVSVKGTGNGSGEYGSSTNPYVLVP